MHMIKMIKRKSCVIFDDVQMYPPARQLIKYLVADGRYDYIETGSLIGLRQNVESIVIPSEDERISLFPLDFEENARSRRTSFPVYMTGYL